MGSGLSQEDLDEKNVVIIGGGFAGTQLASNLAKKGIPFVLIDPKDHFHYTIGALRAAVHPQFIKNILIDYRKTYGDHQFIQACQIFNEMKVYLLYSCNGWCIFYPLGANMI